MFQKMKEHYLSDGPFQQAEMHVYRGEIDEAFLALDQAYTARDAGMVELLTSQFLTPLRGDARWQALLDRMGLSDPGPAILKAAATEGVTVYCAGVDRGADDGLVTAGGRVLAVTARGRDLAQARSRAYEAVDLIEWKGKHVRRDIGGTKS